MKFRIVEKEFNGFVTWKPQYRFKYFPFWFNVISEWFVKSEHCDTFVGVSYTGFLHSPIHKPQVSNKKTAEKLIFEFDQYMSSKFKTKIHEVKH